MDISDYLINYTAPQGANGMTQQLINGGMANQLNQVQPSAPDGTRAAMMNALLRIKPQKFNYARSAMERMPQGGFAPIVNALLGYKADRTDAANAQLAAQNQISGALFNQAAAEAAEQRKYTREDVVEARKRGYDVSDLAAKQNFELGKLGLQNQYDLGKLTAEQKFAAGQSAAQRDFTASQAALGRGADVSKQLAAQDFTASQNYAKNVAEAAKKDLSTADMQKFLANPQAYDLQQKPFFQRLFSKNYTLAPHAAPAGGGQLANVSTSYLLGQL